MIQQTPLRGPHIDFFQNYPISDRNPFEASVAYLVKMRIRGQSRAGIGFSRVFSRL
jgi:hypothetical protein